MAGREHITWDDRALASRLHEFPKEADRALTAIILRYSPILEATMRHNAPWTDRTGNARNGLFARPRRERLKRYAIVLGHTVNYGFWLEVKQAGRYAIVIPTMRTESHTVLHAASQLFAIVFEGKAPPR